MCDNEVYINLIHKYFTNEIDEEELGLLAAWLNQSDEHKLIFDEQRNLWETIHKSLVNKIDTEEEWTKLKDKLFEHKSEPLPQTIFKQRTFVSFMKVAACFAVFVIITFAANYFINKSSIQKIYTNNIVKTCVLPDSSVIILNNGSLEFARPFKNRKITFSGEALFEIKHHSGKPLVISSKNIIIQDMGTKFYVNTLNSNDDITVILIEGSVILYSQNNPETKYTMVPGQKAIFNQKNGEITVSENNDQNYLSWKTKELAFNDESLDKVVTVLNKTYKCNIVIKTETLKNCKITAHFKNQSLYAVLEVLKATLNLSINHTHSVIEFAGNGCK